METKKEGKKQERHRMSGDRRSVARVKKQESRGGRHEVIEVFIFLFFPLFRE